LFAVIRYESVIHEFDPYFNYRTSQYLTEEGFYEFWNWFDDGSWYPLGRVIGQTLFPGLMTTSAVLFYVLNFLGIMVNIRNICVFMAPFFSGIRIAKKNNWVNHYDSGLCFNINPKLIYFAVYHSSHSITIKRRSKLI
jgi:hypothetical protein